MSGFPQSGDSNDPSYCSNCGGSFDADDAYCSNCGKELHAEVNSG